MCNNYIYIYIHTYIHTYIYIYRYRYTYIIYTCPAEDAEEAPLERPGADRDRVLRGVA